MRLTIVLVIQILLASKAYSQFNNILLAKSVPQAPNLFLDDYGFGVTAAWSLRRLDKDYVGNVINIRRNSDNTTLDIGFTGDNLDTTAVKNFCTGTSCQVVTWYDQSGNNWNATIATTTRQPIIYENGAVVRTGGTKNLPSVRFDGVDDYLRINITNLNTAAALSVFGVYSTDLAAGLEVNSMNLWNLGGTTAARISVKSVTPILTAESFVIDVRTSSSNVRRLGSSAYTRAANTLVAENTIFISTGTTHQQNNNSITLNNNNGPTPTTNCTPGAIPVASDLFTLGADGVDFSNQKVSELIVFTADKTSDRSAMTSAINTFYSIY